MPNFGCEGGVAPTEQAIAEDGLIPQLGEVEWSKDPSFEGCGRCAGRRRLDTASPPPMKERIIYFAPIAAAFASGALATGAAVIALDAVGDNPLKAAISPENSDVSASLSTSTEGCAISGHRVMVWTPSQKA